MIKLFSEMKAKDEKLFKEVIQYLKSEPGQGAWFCTKSWNEILKVANYFSEHQFEADLNRVQNRFTDFELSIITAIIQNSRPEAMQNRERCVLTAVQKTSRRVQHYLENRKHQQEIDALRDKMKSRAVKSDPVESWQNLSSVFE